MTLLGCAHAVSGNVTQAQNVLTQLMDLSNKQYVQPSYIALLHACMKDKEKAFEWLEKAFSMRDDRLVFVMTDPLIDGLKSDARFQNLQRRIGLPDGR